jgi:glycosyltransferase involved in cell wall biosynthesis
MGWPLDIELPAVNPLGMTEARKSPVLFVLPQTDASANGGIVSISEVMERLSHHRPIVITDRNTARTETWRKAGIETHVVPMTGRGFFADPAGTFAGYWRNFRTIRRVIASSGAKVVHANSPLAFQLALPAVRLSPGTKTILNLRGTRDPARGVPRRRFEFLFGAADHVFFLSEEMAEFWARVAANAKRDYSVTYSIVDLRKFAPAPPDSGSEPPVVLLSGLIRSLKGQLEFLRHVSPKLAQNGIATWLAGDFDSGEAAYKAACLEAAGPLGDMVEFLGYRTDIPELMRRSSVVAVSSRHEGLVRAMIEAMSCARPVVSFDVCSARELLETKSGGAGKVVPAGDHAAMAEAILEYCQNPQAAKRAGEAGHAAAARLFAPDTVASRYEDVYDRLERSSGRVA